jgi:hypothetical protein
MVITFGLFHPFQHRHPASNTQVNHGSNSVRAEQRMRSEQGEKTSELGSKTYKHIQPKANNYTQLLELANGLLCLCTCKGNSWTRG